MFRGGLEREDFAARSAASLPGIPAWPGIHRILTICSSESEKIVRRICAIIGWDRLCWEERAKRADLLSVHITVF